MNGLHPFWRWGAAKFWSYAVDEDSRYIFRRRRKGWLCYSCLPRLQTNGANAERRVENSRPRQTTGISRSPIAKTGANHPLPTRAAMHHLLGSLGLALVESPEDLRPLQLLLDLLCRLVVPRPLPAALRAHLKGVQPASRGVLKHGREHCWAGCGRPCAFRGRAFIDEEGPLR